MIQGLTIKSGWHWIAFAAAVVHPIFVSLIGALPFVSPLFRLDDHSYFISFWGTMVVAGWTVTLIIVTCLRLSAAGAGAIGLRLPSAWVLLLLVLAAIVLAATIRLMPVQAGLMKQPLLPTLPRTPGEHWFMLFVVAPTAAACEETIYRGLLMRFMATIVGLWPAMILQALLFAYMHGGFAQPLFLIVEGSILGFLLAQLVRWRGDLRAAICIHFLIDALQFSLLP